MIINLLVVLIALFHIYFFILESYLYAAGKGKQVFHLSDEQIKHTQILAFNQGYYNLCLGLQLLLALYLNNIQMLIISLFFVIVVGIIGALSFSKKIFWIQAFPAILTLIFYYCI